MSEPLNKEFGPYELLTVTADTPVGPIYRAREKATGRPVRVLVLSRRWTSDAAYCKRFVQQAQSGMKIGHANLEAVLGVGDVAGDFCLATEWVEGITAAEWLQAQGPLPEQTAYEIARCCANALKQAWHSAQLVHGALTLDEIRVQDDGLVKLTGLAIAKTEEGSRLGDIRALGVALYLMLVNEPPPPMGHRLPDLADKRPGLSPFAGDVLEKMRAAQPKWSYASYDELIEDLTAITEGRQPPNTSAALSLGGLSLQSHAAPQATTQPVQTLTPAAKRVRRQSSFNPGLLAKPIGALILVGAAWYAVDIYNRSGPLPPSAPSAPGPAATQPAAGQPSPQAPSAPPSAPDLSGPALQKYREAHKQYVALLKARRYPEAAACCDQAAQAFQAFNSPLFQTAFQLAKADALRLTKLDAGIRQNAPSLVGWQLPAGGALLKVARADAQNVYFISPQGGLFGQPFDQVVTGRWRSWLACHPPPGMPVNPDVVIAGGLYALYVLGDRGAAAECFQAAANVDVDVVRYQRLYRQSPDEAEPVPVQPTFEEIADLVERGRKMALFLGQEKLRRMFKGKVALQPDGQIKWTYDFDNLDEMMDFSTSQLYQQDSALLLRMAATNFKCPLRGDIVVTVEGKIAEMEEGARFAALNVAWHGGSRTFGFTPAGAELAEVIGGQRHVLATAPVSILNVPSVRYVITQRGNYCMITIRGGPALQASFRQLAAGPLRLNSSACVTAYTTLEITGTAPAAWLSLNAEIAK